MRGMCGRKDGKVKLLCGGLIKPNVAAVWLVKPPTTATYEIQMLIGFINHTAC